MTEKINWGMYGIDEAGYNHPVWWKVECQIEDAKGYNEYQSVYTRAVSKRDAIEKARQLLKYPIIAVMEVDDRGEYRNV